MENLGNTRRRDRFASRLIDFPDGGLDGVFLVRLSAARVGVGPAMRTDRYQRDQQHRLEIGQLGVLEQWEWAGCDSIECSPETDSFRPWSRRLCSLASSFAWKYSCHLGNLQGSTPQSFARHAPGIFSTQLARHLPVRPAASLVHIQAPSHKRRTAERVSSGAHAGAGPHVLPLSG